jgi:hypothetical protein
MKRRMLTFSRPGLHELDVVVFVVCASLCDHVFDALFFQRGLFRGSSVMGQNLSSSCLGWLYRETSLVLFE